MEKNSPSKIRDIKANTLLCPSCCVEFVEVEFDIEIDSQILQKVKALRCPACREEHFTQDQIESIKKRIIDPELR